MAGLAEIAPIPPVPQHDLLTYRVPDGLDARLAPGMRVRIPLGRQTRTGVVAGFATAPPPGQLRSILGVLDEEPLLPPDLLELCRWTARYYLASQASVIATIVPRAVPAPSAERVLCLRRRLDATEEAVLERRAPARARAYRTLVAAEELVAAAVREAGLGPAAVRWLVDARVAEWVVRERPPEAFASASETGKIRLSLTNEQETAVAALGDALDREASASFLLFGVTGSGKTEVFLTAAERALAAGRGVLVLVPEIALTHQVVERVTERFGSAVAVLHSGLGPRHRWSEWRRILAGTARVVVGARSAVFAPVRRLGLVVVDEEHDAAYKQEDGLRYNARDLAVVRARLAKGVAVLASATPSAESYHAACEGRHQLLELRSRPTTHSLPDVALVDLRSEPREAGRPRLFSDPLQQALEENLARGSQSLIFLNRRGYATYLQCAACGATPSCPQCSVTLTWHRRAGAVVCHHCHHHRRTPTACPDCGGTLDAFGVGTEQIEAGLRACYPVAKVDRLDRDAARRLGAQRRILRDWQAGDIDILVGTQMVSKGHDVPGVTLVAVLLADISLNVPDFRAAERTFQLLVQVAGRAGRGESAGRVVVQTLRPAHPSLVAAARHDYVGFMRDELERRRALGYPPFTRLVNIRVDGADNAAVERTAQELGRVLRGHASALGLGAETVLGPAPPPLERVRGRYRWQVLLRGSDVPALRRLARAARAWEPQVRRARLRLAIDVDPYGI